MNEVKNNSTQFQIVNINPEPIGVFTLPKEKHLSYKKILWTIWNESPREMFQKYTDNKEHLCSGSNLNLFKSFSQLNNLKSDISKFIIEYTNYIGSACEDVIINSAWLNNSKKGSTLDYHFHSNSFVSANYFINFTPGNHSQLTFQNDRVFSGKYPDYPTFVIPSKDTPTIFNAPSIGLEAKEGQIFVWRSHKVHGYSEPNKEDNRLTLSLNSMPKILDNGKYSFSIIE